MKLVTKISAAVIGLLLLFSQAFSVWTLSNARRQMIDNILENEWDKMDARSLEFNKSLKTGSEEELIYRSRQLIYHYFGTNTVLYYEGKEIANSTPYEFDLERAEQSSHRYKSGDWKTTGDRMTFLEKAGGADLLILYDKVNSFQLVSYRDITSVEKYVKNLFFRGMGVAAALSLILMGILQLIVRKILSPFYSLKDAANVIADGHYEERVPVAKKDEIGEVSASFNRMADRVEEHIGELEEMNRKQHQLLGSLAHELKTPMTAIQGYAETLQRIQLPPEKQEKALAYMESECKRLSRLSAKMLELTMLTGNEESIGMERKRLKVLALLNRVREITDYRMKEKDICLEVQADEELEITGDEDLLISLLTNLTDNAWKASSRGGRIRLIGEAQGISVKDEGRGIPEEELAYITEPFYMADKSRARKEGGAGLGLALCSQIARLHGARLKIQSRPGQGTVVTFCLQSGGDLETENRL